MIEGPYIPKPSWWGGFKWGMLVGMFIMFISFQVGCRIDNSHLFTNWPSLNYGKMFGWLGKLREAK